MNNNLEKSYEILRITIWKKILRNLMNNNLEKILRHHMNNNLEKILWNLTNNNLEKNLKKSDE